MELSTANIAVEQCFYESPRRLDRAHFHGFNGCCSNLSILMKCDHSPWYDAVDSNAPIFSLGGQCVGRWMVVELTYYQTHIQTFTGKVLYHEM